MKVIFLDHDGVICLQHQWGTRFKNRTLFDNFDTKAVKVLNSILQEVQCEIVVSSDWRLHCDLNHMKQTYRDRGVLQYPYDYTPKISSYREDVWKETESYRDQVSIDAKVREFEIREWLDQHPCVTHWVAIDDLPMKRLSNFVHTRYPLEGIKQTGIKDKVLSFLR